MEIAPGIHLLQVPIPDNPLGNLNCYVLRGTKGWLMIDTGWYTPEAFDSLGASLKTLGLDFTDIATIIVTHVHPDHFGLAGRIKHVSPRTELLTHKWEADLIESRYIKFSELVDKMETLLRKHGVPEANAMALRSASMPALKFVTVTLPDHVLYGGEIVSTGVFDLEVIWTPGHSPGHICLYEPNQKLFFSGDHILATITPNISYNVQSGDDPLGEYLGALLKVRHLPAVKVLPAHEHVMTDLNKRVTEIMEHHVQRGEEILKVIGRKAMNAYDISAQVTWNIPGTTWEKLPILHKRSAVMETIAHLDHLRYDGRLEKVVDNGLVLYRLRGS